MSFPVGTHITIDRFPFTLDPKPTHEVVGHHAPNGYLRIAPIGSVGQKGALSLLPPSAAIKF